VIWLPSSDPSTHWGFIGAQPATRVSGCHPFYFFLEKLTNDDPEYKA
jgi:hypothetical protein